MVEEITFDEHQHVMLLRSALGSAAIAKPAINLDALNTGFEGFLHFIALARAFEDVGVSAYGGAAPLITSKDILATAARIALTEAQHAGSLRTLAAANKDPYLTPVDSQDILPPPTGEQYFTVNGQALSIVRTSGQVLAIVYHNTTSGASAGGILPAWRQRQHHQRLVGPCIPTGAAAIESKRLVKNSLAVALILNVHWVATTNAMRNKEKGKINQECLEFLRKHPDVLHCG